MMSGWYGRVLRGSASVLGAANDIVDLGAFAAGSFALTDAEALTVKGDVDTGSGTLSLKTNVGNIAIDGSLTGGTVDLTAAAKATEKSSGAIIANLLNVTADTGITLTSTHNDITNIGTDQTNTGPNRINKS